ncbi:MAG: hypothetical protein JXJ04_02630 [Spirochaetales bacterium]|nr:hypothetical protein [Spirochaetales bacterium]
MRIFIFILFFSIITSIYAEIPLLKNTDILFKENKTGYDLYIRKIKGIESILLTESQRDPEFKRTTYSLRTPDPSPEHINEIRYLDGNLLSQIKNSYFLIDSSPIDHPVLQKAFHFDFPREVLYGLPWTRHGKIKIEPGIIINARLFKKKYADYSGEYTDQWITLVPGNTLDTPGDGDNLSKESSDKNNSEDKILEVSSFSSIKKDTEIFEAGILPNEPGLPEPDVVSKNREKPEDSTDPLDPDFTEEIILKDASGKEIKKTIYRGNDDGSRIIESFLIYEYDKNLLGRITEYNGNAEMLSFYLFEYDDHGNRINVGHFNPDGNIILRE